MPGDPVPSPSIRASGFLVSAPEAELRTLIVSNEIIAFSADHVIDMEELALPDGISSVSGIRPVRVELSGEPAFAGRAGSPAVRRAPIGDLPFAFAVRRRDARAFDSPCFRALETAFLEEHGLRP